MQIRPLLHKRPPGDCKVRKDSFLKGVERKREFLFFMNEQKQKKLQKQVSKILSQYDFVSFTNHQLKSQLRVALQKQRDLRAANLKI